MGGRSDFGVVTAYGYVQVSSFGVYIWDSAWMLVSTSCALFGEGSGFEVGRRAVE